MMFRFPSKYRSSDGYAVAEFAVTLPALLSVVGICFWTIGLAVTKFEQENLTSNAARILARGQDLPEDYFNRESANITWQVSESNGRINISTQIYKTIPILNKQIELSSFAESLSEVYEFQE